MEYIYTMKEFKRPEGYNYPYFTSTKVAELLDLSLPTVVKYCNLATEVVPGTFLWTEKNIMKLVNLNPKSGMKTAYKNTKWYKEKNNSSNKE